MRMEGSCAEGELGVGEQGKEGARGCRQTEGEADVEAITGIILSSALLPQRYLTPLIHEGLHVQKRQIPRSHRFHPQRQTRALLKWPCLGE